MNKITTLNLAALLLAGVAFTACSGDDDETVLGEPAKKTVTLTVNATKGTTTVDDETRALQEINDLPTGNNYLRSTWTNGTGVGSENQEKVYVFPYNNYTTPCGTSQSEFLYPTSSDTDQTNLYGAITVDGDFPGRINLVYTGKGAYEDFGASWKSSSVLLKYSGQFGTLEDIANYHDFAKAENVQVVKNGNSYKSTGDAIFVNQQAIVKFNFLLKVSKAGKVEEYILLKDIKDAVITAKNGDQDVLVEEETAGGRQETGSLTFSNLYEREGATTNYWIYAALRGTDSWGDGKKGFNARSFDITVRTKDKDGNVDKTYKKTGATATFEHGKFYVVNVMLKEKAS